MPDSVDYEILVNGVTRTSRDAEGVAIAAAREVFLREKGAGKIVVINRKLGLRWQVKETVSAPVWTPLRAE